MKITASLIPLLLTSVSANAIALPGEEYYVVKSTELGQVYSNVPAHQRRDVKETFYPISTDKHATVYSNVAPTDDQTHVNAVYTPRSDDKVNKDIIRK